MGAISTGAGSEYLSAALTGEDIEAYISKRFSSYKSRLPFDTAHPPTYDTSPLTKSFVWLRLRAHLHGDLADFICQNVALPNVM